MSPSPSPTRGGPRWRRVIAGIAVLVVLGVPCLLGLVAVAVGGNQYVRRSAVADGRAPGQLRFDAGRERYVVALSAKPRGLASWWRSSRTETRRYRRVRESDATQARCTVTHPGGATTQLRGDRQTHRELVGTSYATVGEFDGRGGPTTVACRFDPVRDLVGTVTETPLMVHPRSDLAHGLLWGFVAGLLAIVATGVLLILRGTVWRPARA